MEANILVYDNREEYYQVLKNARNSNTFILYNKRIESFENINMLIFFLNDIPELADYVKLFRKDIPVVLGMINEVSFKDKDYMKDRNVHLFNLKLPKGSILQCINKVVSKVFGDPASTKKAG
jgi:hypothetical protein